METKELDSILKNDVVYDDEFTIENVLYPEYKPVKEYKRNFPRILKEDSPSEDKLKYAVKQVVLKSKEREFTYEQLTEAIRKGDPKLYMDQNVIGRTVKELGYVKKNRTRKGIRKYYYVYAPDINH